MASSTVGRQVGSRRCKLCSIRRCNASTATARRRCSWPGWTTGWTLSSMRSQADGCMLGDVNTL